MDKDLLGVLTAALLAGTMLANAMGVKCDVRAIDGIPQRIIEVLALLAGQNSY